jgi:NAD(P)H-hydrate epimerase
MKIVTACQMKELDARTTREAGIPERTLIARAGEAAAEWITRRYAPGFVRILVLVGKGNNGADALAVAARLRRLKYRVQVVRGWERGALSKIQRAVREAPVELLVIDGLFGTGLNRRLGEPYLPIVSFLERSGVRVIALDIPSGLDADSGIPWGASLVASQTLTFQLPKLGLVQEHAADRVGELHVLDIGFPENLMAEIRTPYDLITAEELKPVFLARKRGSYKGDQGHVLVIGGSVGFAGAPALAARGALFAGAGLVTLAVPQTIYSVSAGLAGAEVMVHPLTDRNRGWVGRSAWPMIRTLLKGCSAVVIGPGIGTCSETGFLLEKVLRESTVPIVVDAGGLSLLASKTAILRKASAEVVITPHPGEMGRLVNLTAREVQRKRFEVAEAFARRHVVTVVLKGCRTLVAHPGARRVSVNALAGNPGMASGGVGDVLGGVIGACLARGLKAADAARAGVFLHACAGDLACVGRAHLVAGDLVQALPAAQLAIGCRGTRLPFCGSAGIE